VLSFLKRNPEPAVTQIEPPQRAAQHGAPANRTSRWSGDCAAAFAAIAEAQGFSKAALFEDMVAERLQQLERQGVKLNIG
jgi:hypothetical protein